MSRAGALFRLQQVDSDLDAARLRLREIEARMADSTAVREAQSRLAEAEARLAEQKKKARALEDDIRAVTDKAQDVEAQLYGGRVRNPKELQDLQADAASLQKRRSALEDGLLEIMLGAEEADKARQAAQAALTLAQAQSAQVNTALTADKANLDQRLARLEIEREAAEAGVPAGDRTLYQGLRSQKRGVAVARLQDGACGSCGVAPSSSRIQAARQGGELVRCGNCERILYAE